MSNVAVENVTVSVAKELLKAPNLKHLRIAQLKHPHFVVNHMDEEYSCCTAIHYNSVRDVCNSIRLSSRQVRVRVFGYDYLK